MSFSLRRLKKRVDALEEKEAKREEEASRRLLAAATLEGAIIFVAGNWFVYRDGGIEKARVSDIYDAGLELRWGRSDA